MQNLRKLLGVHKNDGLRHGASVKDFLDELRLLLSVALELELLDVVQL